MRKLFKRQLLRGIMAKPSELINYYRYTTKEEGDTYHVLLALPNAGADAGYYFRWQNGCWRMVEAWDGDIGF